MTEQEIKIIEENEDIQKDINELRDLHFELVKIRKIESEINYRAS